jgi:hypothetical protein
MGKEKAKKKEEVNRNKVYRQKKQDNIGRNEYLKKEAQRKKNSQTN